MGREYRYSGRSLTRAQPVDSVPSIFLKELWILDPPVVERRLEEQARAIGVSKNLLLDRLAKSVPTRQRRSAALMVLKKGESNSSHPVNLPSDSPRASPFHPIQMAANRSLSQTGLNCTLTLPAETLSPTDKLCGERFQNRGSHELSFCSCHHCV